MSVARARVWVWGGYEGEGGSQIGEKAKARLTVNAPGQAADKKEVKIVDRAHAAHHHGRAADHHHQNMVQPAFYLWYYQCKHADHERHFLEVLWRRTYQSTKWRLKPGATM